MLVTDSENRRLAKEFGIKVGAASAKYKKNKKNAKINK
jgi:hypothetical protein